MKDVNVSFRTEKELLDTFTKKVKSEGLDRSLVFREMMRSYIRKNRIKIVPNVKFRIDNVDTE